MLKNLKILREEHEITQSELGDILFLSQQAISHYENDNTEPTIDILIKISDYFNVSIDYLVGRECVVNTHTHKLS